MLSAFPHLAGPPRPESLPAVLGLSLPLWEELAALLEAASGAPGSWKSYGPSCGWRLDFRRKAGPLAGLYPQPGQVLVGLNLLRKEWAPADALALTPATARILAASKPLKDGRVLLIPVRAPDALEDIRRLIGLKMGTPVGA